MTDPTLLQMNNGLGRLIWDSSKGPAMRSYLKENGKWRKKRRKQEARLARVHGCAVHDIQFMDEQ